MSLSPEKRRKLEEFIRDRVDASRYDASRMQSPPEGRYKASFPQQELWMAQQLAPDRCMYNMIWRASLEKPYSVDTISSAIQRIVDRHDALRTCFHVEEGQITAYVIQSANVLTEVLDGRDMTEGQLRQREEQWCTDLLRKPFRLDAELPIRTGICLPPEGGVRVYIVVHHVAFDAWSAGLVLKELSAICRGDPLPQSESAYSEFASWQHREVRGPAEVEALEYWRSVLVPTPAPVTIPEDRPREPRRLCRGRRTPLVVEERTMANVANLAEQCGASVFVTMLAAYKVLMHKYTGETDITVGTLVSNRSQRRFETAIGCFVNTLMLRTRIEPDMPVADLVSLVNETVRAGKRHQEIPYQQVLSELGPPRVPGRFPFAQTMFVFQDIPDWGLKETRDSIERLENGAAFFDLTFTFNGSRSNSGWIEYDSDLYHEYTIRHAADYYVSTLELMSDGQNLAISMFPGPADAPVQPAAPGER